jgi:Methyltransferase domain
MWDQRYSEPGYAYGLLPNDFLVSQAGRIRPGGKVLCLAEGEGRNAVWLASRGFQVTGMDQSSVGMAKARALAAERGLLVSFEVGDLATFDLGSEAWDAIVSCWCHLPQPLRSDVHARVVQALRPGGALILEAYTPAQILLGTGGPREPSLCMTLESLRVELEGLRLAVAEEKERMVGEGKYHQGKSAVVQVVGLKAA